MMNNTLSESIFVERVTAVSKVSKPHKARGLEVVALVQVSYHNLSIKTKLVRGFNLEKYEVYYFLEMPCFFLKNNLSKINYVRFKEKSELEVFQMTALLDLQKKNPELFAEYTPLTDEQIEEMKKKKEALEARKDCKLKDLKSNYREDSKE